MINQQPEEIAPTPKPEEPPVDYLKEIAGHLKSIRSMLTFFTVMFILAIIIQACSILT